MLRTSLYRTGGLLLVAGAVLPLIAPQLAPYIFALGVVLFCPIQLTEKYPNETLTIKRLRVQQGIGAIMLLITAALMFTSLYQIRPFRGSEWKIALMIATVFQLYTTFRIDHELKR